MGSASTPYQSSEQKASSLTQADKMNGFIVTRIPDVNTNTESDEKANEGGDRNDRSKKGSKVLSKISMRRKNKKDANANEVPVPETETESKPATILVVDLTAEDFTWRMSFIEKCAELVELRYANAISTVLVKPFNEKFEYVWEPTEESDQLEISDIEHHQVANAQEKTGDLRKFSELELKKLMRNFFQVASAYRMRHPYMLAGIQTGLENKREVYEFSKFRVDENITAKLCVGLPERSALWCHLQLKVLLTPDLLKTSYVNLERTVKNLFMGFGPDWITLSRLTGRTQIELRSILGAILNIDSCNIPVPMWYQIHRDLLDKEISVKKTQKKIITF